MLGFLLLFFFGLSLLSTFCFVFQGVLAETHTSIARHRDTFPGGPQRKLTLLYYFNPTWTEGDGGELQLFTVKGSKVVSPLADRLVHSNQNHFSVF